MRLVGSSEAQGLTGLSADQLREWTGRRGLIHPDQPAKGKGTQMRFSWHTLLVLRLASELKTRLNVELHAHRDTFNELQTEFRRTSYLSLWESAVVLSAPGRLVVTRMANLNLRPEETVVVLPLVPHLRVLTSEFGLHDTLQQYPLLRPASVQ